MVLHHSIVGGFGLGRRDVADGLQQPTIVVPVDPLERGVLDGIKRSPRSFAPDHLSFVEAVDRFGERDLQTLVQVQVPLLWQIFNWLSASTVTRPVE